MLYLKPSEAAKFQKAFFLRSRIQVVLGWSYRAERQIWIILFSVIFLATLPYISFNSNSINKVYCYNHTSGHGNETFRTPPCQVSFSCSKNTFVHLSVRSSARYTFFAMFLQSYHLEISRRCVITNDRSDVYAKCQGQMSKVKVTEVKT